MRSELTDWVQLIINARADKDEFVGLVKVLDPIFRAIAIKMTHSYHVDDLVQVAQIKVWQSLMSVDLNRPETVKWYLTRIGINAIITVSRQNRSVAKFVDLDVSYGAKTLNDDIQFDGLLNEYAEYIQHNGKFDGSHRYLAAKHGVSVWVMREMFNTAAKVFINEYHKEKGLQ